ncbi:MAG: hypothetical protein BWZ08_00380 [candidate division BRC1 bacterium ADurb.BinA292]|nr:MAG: hypothetical protein BWZ08_00380 [candidate division BRC1 bacterium ADurb.BinA292]
MTPDGRDVAVAWDVGRYLSIFRLTPEPPYLEEVEPITRRNRIFCMKFLPQARPSAAGEEWNEDVRRDGRLSAAPALFAGGSLPAPALVPLAGGLPSLSPALLRRWLPGPWRLAPLFPPARE